MYKFIVIPLFILSGCSTIFATKETTKSHDPIEPLNRKIFSINTKIDKHVIAPIATKYKKNTPAFIQSGVNNFFSNLDDIPTTINSALQGKWTNAGKSFIRLATNSTFGIIGLIDVAGEAGIKKTHEDFGQTLGHYGIGDGIYIVLPFYGSTNLRAGLWILADLQTNPLYPYNTTFEQTTYALDKINTRKQYLGLEQMLEEQPDPYIFVRESYYQKRKNSIYDGNAPKVTYDDDEE